MPLRIADDDPNLNPGQVHANQQFNGLKKAEEDGNFGDNGQTADDSGSSNIDDAEKNPNSDWKNNVSGDKPSQTSGGRFSFVKKKGPLTAIIITLVGGGFGIAGLLSPALLIVNLKEIMVNKFNSQLTSMDMRTTKILTSKTTGGMLCGSLNVGCKYSSMSKTELSNFEKAGIKVNYNEKTAILGQAKPESFEFNGKTIKASEFTNAMQSNIEFRAAIKTAYNPKFAGFADSIWKKAAAKLGVSKKTANLDGETDDEKLKSIQEETQTSSTIDENNPNPVQAGDEDPETGQPYDEAGAKAANEAIEESAIEATRTIEEDIAKIEATSVKSASAVLDGLGKTLSITGAAEMACTVYGNVQAVGYAAKTVRALQLARYAMIFLNVADQIKAGVAKPGDVSYLGKILTTEISNDTKVSNPVYKSATDSFGYKYAAYGEIGQMSTSASQFLAGGGLTGNLISLTASIDKVIPEKSVCGTLKNPFVSSGSLVIGLVLLLSPLGPAIAIKDIAVGLGIGVAAAATAFLPAMLKDIIAGVLVDKTTVGENAGDAITSGSSGMMNTAAASGGNAPLTPSQAVAYNDLSNNIAEQYAEENRLAYSPFDVTNSNTFMGSIISKLTPYISKMSSLSGALSSMASIVTESLASTTLRTTKAASVSDYTMCQDYDYKALGVATDPYCNIIYGIPVEALDEDPIAIASSLVGQIDETTGDPIENSKYDTFIKDCINRDRPLGDSGSDYGKDGSECKFNNTNKNYYLYFIDQRVENGMDGTDTALAAAETSSKDRSISFYSNSANYNSTAFNVSGN
jgi:hypothetical protein